MKRLARKDCLRLPHFIRDLEAYKKKLYQIGVTNGLIPKAEKRVASPSKSPLLCRRTQLVSPFRRRKLLESGFVGAPSLPPFLPCGSSRPRRQPRSSFEEVTMQPSPKASAEVIFVNEAPSTSTVHNDQFNTDFNNHCNNIEYDDYEHGNVNYQQVTGKRNTAQHKVYFTNENNCKERIFEETYILPSENFNPYQSDCDTLVSQEM